MQHARLPCPCQFLHCRFGVRLGLRVVELTGDTDAEVDLNGELSAADLICTTPEKLGRTSRVEKQEIPYM